MARIVRNSTWDEVKRHLENIDATGLNDGYPRNDPLFNLLSSLFTSWNFCELTENEFNSLLIPQDPHILLKDKDLNDIEGEDSNFVVQKYHNDLVNGDSLPTIVIRERFPNNLVDCSFYIEDGAHRALALKKFYLTNSYIPVNAFIGYF